MTNQDNQSLENLTDDELYQKAIDVIAEGKRPESIVFLKTILDRSDTYHLAWHLLSKLALEDGFVEKSLPALDRQTINTRQTPPNDLTGRQEIQ